MSEPSVVDLEVQLLPGDIGADRLERLTATLRHDLEDVRAVRSVATRSVGPAPAGARAVDVAELGTLLVTLAQTAAGLTALVGAVQAWLSGQPSGRVRIRIGDDELEVDGRLSDDQRRLMAVWVDRHAQP